MAFMDFSLFWDTVNDGDVKNSPNLQRKNIVFAVSFLNLFSSSVPLGMHAEMKGYSTHSQSMNRMINWETGFFSTLLNVTQPTSNKGYFCATDKEGFSTGKRCLLVSITDGVGEKERNYTKISQLNLQGLFYSLARWFYIVPDVLLFLYLSITAYPFFLQFLSSSLFICLMVIDNRFT